MTQAVVALVALPLGARIPLVVTAHATTQDIGIYTANQAGNICGGDGTGQGSFYWFWSTSRRRLAGGPVGQQLR